MSRRVPFVLVCLVLSACGAERPPAPDPFAVQPPRGQRAEAVPAGALRLQFRRPANWSFSRDRAPRLFTVRSGQAVVVGWAYPRAEPLPRRGPALDSARESLVGEVMRRDPRFQVAGSRVLDVAEAPAVEVSGSQVVSKRTLRVRSVHLFEGGTEVVVEALAPPAAFARVDAEVLEPLLRSLRLG